MGASYTGKTRFFDYVLNNKESSIGNLKGSKKIDRLIICYAVHDSIYSKWTEIAPVCIYHKGLPTVSELEDGTLIKKGINNLMILDDLDDRENECETIHRLEWYLRFFVMKKILFIGCLLFTVIIIPVASFIHNTSTMRTPHVFCYLCRIF